MPVSDAGISTPDRDQRIAALEALLATRDAALAGARADIAARDLLIDMLRVQIARMKRMQFGKSSEKLTREIAQLELALEELETAATAVVGDDRRGKATTDRMPPVRSLPAHLPRIEIIHEPVSGTCACRPAAARCDLSAPMLTRCSTLFRSVGGSFAISAPSIAAAPARPSFRHRRR